MNKLSSTLASVVISGVFASSHASAMLAEPWYLTTLNDIDHKRMFYMDSINQVSEERNDLVQRIDYLGSEVAEANEGGYTRRVQNLTRRIELKEQDLSENDQLLSQIDSRLDKLNTIYDTPWYISILNKIEQDANLYNRKIDQYTQKNVQYVNSLDYYSSQLSGAVESGNDRRVRSLERRVALYKDRLEHNEQRLGYLDQKREHILSARDKACAHIPPQAQGGGWCSASGG